MSLLKTAELTRLAASRSPMPRQANVGPRPPDPQHDMCRWSAVHPRSTRHNVGRLGCSQVLLVGAVVICPLEVVGFVSYGRDRQSFTLESPQKVPRAPLADWLAFRILDR